jgi:hypothetical protein
VATELVASPVVLSSAELVGQGNYTHSSGAVDPTSVCSDGSDRAAFMSHRSRDQRSTSAMLLTSQKFTRTSG